MRLGEWLVGEGLITVQQLEAALRAQILYGGRLGTNLVELGSIDLDDLARALAKRAGVPAALQRHFEQADPAAIALVPLRVVSKHLAVPIGFTRAGGRQLAVAFMDPDKLAAADEIGFVAGVRIVISVAPELRIHYYLERLYGVPRKNRYMRVSVGAADGPAVPPHERRRFVEPYPPVTLAIEVEPPLDLPAARPRAPEPEAPPPRATLAKITPVPRAIPRDAAPPVPRSQPQPAVPVPPDVIDEGEDVTTTIDIELGPGVEARPLPGATPAAASVPPVAHPRRPALSAADALARIAGAGRRDEIGDLVVDYLRSSFGAGLVFIVRQEMALGWKGFAAGVEDATIEALALPLTQASLLRLAHDKRTIFRGAPPADGAVLHGRLWKLLRITPPREVVVVPIVIKTRVVNLVYAHALGGELLADAAIADLVAVCAAAGDGFTRMIQAAKPSQPR